ncbi:MAG: hypothetical protein IKY83_14290 [Proteobacteria bacterium]|nr:hypothetical protein [Pseudomonadota bacterium]
MSKRKLAFLLGAVMVSGFSLLGCEEEDPFKPADVVDSENPGNPSKPKVPTLNDYSAEDGINAANGKLHKDMSGAKKACLRSDCMTSKDCADGVDYWACLCSTDSTSANKCTTWAACRDIGNCKIECGPGKTINGQESCSLSVCAGASACASACIPENLPADGDYDQDGIPNLVERNSSGLEDPCLLDTDGDTIPDGYEDLNHNGVYEPHLGETLPNDPSSMPANGHVYDLQQVVCQAGDMLGGSASELKEIRIAKMKSAVYEIDSDPNKEVTVFEDSAHKVAGFFGTLSAKRYTGPQLLRESAIKDGYYAEESNFTSSMPLNVWLENKTEAGVPVYDRNNLQVIPDHTVSRYKYSITLESGQTLENVRDAIAKVFDANLSVSKATGNTACDSGSDDDKGKAILYLARSEYKEGGKAVYAYSGALTCRSTNTSSKQGAANAIEAMNMLDDVISGTLVAPIGLPAAPTGFDPFKDFVCQPEVFGNAAGTVDFIWVIDNSGSMQDELTNLTNTVSAFTERLATSGIDYRLAVTTTDAYLLDETGKVTSGQYGYGSDYTPLVINSDSLGTDLRSNSAQSYDTNVYLNYLGVHTVKNSLNCFIDKDMQGGVDIFIQNVAGKKTASTTTPNINGKGYEDGLKSGAMALERLGLAVSPSVADIKDELLYTVKDKDMFATLKRKTAYFSPQTYSKCEEKPTSDNCISLLANCNLRENALKYIIWVSDEESRQFKEGPDKEHENTLLSSSPNNLYGCRTGFKLSNGSMKTGQYGGGGDGECNATMADTLETLVDASGLTYDMSLEEIKAAAPEYHAMLDYYLKIYQRYAGESDVTGFALVGDIGASRGGICTTLKICDGVCKDKDGNVDESKNGKEGIGCFKCEGTYKESSSAVVGANYGLSYIHMARFLSKEKEGGFASICNTSFETSIDAIFEDVAGRVASHPLKGYPIASTIRVAVKSGTKSKELTRGAAKDGWSYDASQNAIVFSGANIKKDDYIAISYVIWKKNEG